jgi:beta-glucosidase
MPAIEFPPGFVWGTATSAFQIEGAAREDGRGESIWDRFAATRGAVRDGTSGDVACDHYHRYAEDVGIMRELGAGAYRFSIAWPRVIPGGRGAVNARGLDFYSRLVDCLLEARITPYVTLYHWDLPQPLQDEGGWASRATAEAFARFADVVSRRLGDRVKHWITHNEPWCASHLGYRTGLHAPGLRDGAASLRARHHLLLSHGWAVPLVRANSPEAEVGITLNLTHAVPASSSQEDHEACRAFDGGLNRWFLDALHRGSYPLDVVDDYARLGHLPAAGLASFVLDGDMWEISRPIDFVGVNYYNRTVVRSDAIPEAMNRPRTVHLAPESEWTQMGWEVYPDGLFQILVRVHEDYRPTALLVTENGASYGTGPDASGRIRDVSRQRYLHDHFLAARRAIDRGVPLRGYFVWSLLDNFEWDWGYSQRFGLVWVDYETQRRTLKDSALWFRGVVTDNAVPEADPAPPLDRSPQASA